MELIFAIALLWGGFLCGIIFCKGFKDEQDNNNTIEEKTKSKTSFRSPLVRYE